MLDLYVLVVLTALSIVLWKFQSRILDNDARVKFLVSAISSIVLGVSYLRWQQQQHKEEVRTQLEELGRQQQEHREKLYAQITDLATSTSTRCSYVVQPGHIPDDLKGIHEAIGHQCEINMPLRNGAILEIPRERIMTTWCDLIGQANEVLATNLAGPLDWSQFQGHADPCALKCQLSANHDSKIRRVFFVDEADKGHAEFSHTCAITQRKHGITTRTFPLSRIASASQDFVRTRDAAGSLDVVVFQLATTTVGMLTEVDNGQNEHIAIRSYLYTDPERIASLRRFFERAWQEAEVAP